MKRPKRNPASTATEAVKAMVDATKDAPAVPDHVRVRPMDLPFWDGIVSARARDEWTPADLVVAAQLARCQAEIEVESHALDAESTVVLNDRGTRVMNARVTVLEQLARREMALMRTLRMGGRVAGDSRDEAGRRKLQNQARQIREEMADDELLAS